MEGKKISFGFMKTKKAEKPIELEKKDYIQCLEEKSIKIMGGDQIEATSPLVIAMKPNTLMTAERLKEIADEVESVIDDDEKHEVEPEIQAGPPQNETLDQMAIRELLQEARATKFQHEEVDFLIPTKPKYINDGSNREPTIDDYESIPVKDFGAAMLRGMGWKPGQESKFKQPELRPKGLGLGAENKCKSNKDGDDLLLKSGSHVKIIFGKHSGACGKVVSMDEDSGRVMVELSKNKLTVNINEVAIQLISKTEYEHLSRVLNAEQYETYNKMKSKSGHQNTKNRINSEKTNKDPLERDYRQNIEKITSDERHLSSKNNEERFRHDRENNDGNDDTESRNTSSESTLGKQQYSKSRDKEDVWLREERSGASSGKNRREVEETYTSRYKHDDYQRSERSNRKGSEDIRRYSSERNSRNEKSSNCRQISEAKYRHRSNSTSEPDRRDNREYNKTVVEKRESSISSNEEIRHPLKTDCRNSSYTSDESSKKAKKTKKAKKDVDKKRKGKKKKRDRDRSPSHKKYKK